MNKSEMIGCIKGETLAHWNLLQDFKSGLELDFYTEIDVRLARARWCVLDDLCNSLGIGETSDFLNEQMEEDFAEKERYLKAKARLAELEAEKEELNALVDCFKLYEKSFFKE